MRLEDVFGIGAGKIATYVERGADLDFKQFIQSKKHIVLHGSSKQGKTSLRKRHLSADDAIVVSCQSNWDLGQLYLSILKRADCHPVLTAEKSGSGEGRRHCPLVSWAPPLAVDPSDVRICGRSVRVGSRH
jgi:hypothetical protein